MQHDNACLLSVSFPDIHQRMQLNGKHISWYCKGHIGGIWNLIFPYENNSYLTILSDTWVEGDIPAYASILSAE